jgi:multidrug resistance protein, MATE family
LDLPIEPQRMQRTFASELAATVKLAWPVVLGQVAIVGMNLVDTVVAGRVSAQVLAEVALGTSVWGFVLLGTMGVMMALAPEIAGLRGSGRERDSAAVLNQGLYLALMVSSVAVLVWWAAPWVLPWLEVEPSLIPGALDFLDGICLGAPALAWYLALQKFCEGFGRTRATLYFSVLGLVCLLPMCAAFVHGLWGFPRWLSFGAGLAMAVVYWINAIAISVYVWRQFAPHHALRRWHRPDWTRLSALAGFGFPIAFTILMEAGLFYSVVLLMSRFGKDWVAAHSVAINVASFAFMLPLGLANAVTVRVGFGYGAGDTFAVRRAALSGYVLCLVTQGFSAMMMLMFALPIAKIYMPHEPQVAVMAASLIVFAAVFQFPDGIQVISAGALRGLKDAKWPMVLTMFAYWGLGFPLAHHLAFVSDLHARGLWWGFTLGLSAAALMLTYRFWRLARINSADKGTSGGA